MVSKGTGHFGPTAAGLVFSVSVAGFGEE